MQKYIKNNQELIQYLKRIEFNSNDKKIITEYHYSKNKLMFQIFDYIVHESKRNWSKCLKLFKVTYKKYLEYLKVVHEAQPNITMDDFIAAINKINDLVHQYTKSFDDLFYFQIMNNIDDLKQKINLDIDEIAEQYIQSVAEVKKANIF